MMKNKKVFLHYEKLYYRKKYKYKYKINLKFN